jgi:phenylacetate-CoA ligase
MIREMIYNKSPVFFQNVMTSIYGFQLHLQRYGGKNKEYTAQLEKTNFENKENLQQLQNDNLGKLLKYSYQHTDYYKLLFDNLGLKPEDIREEKDLKKLPILTKDTLRKSPEAFIPRNIKKKELLKIFTSGTTGSPLTVYYNLQARRKYYAFFNRVRKWHGIQLGDTRATFYGRILIPQNQKGPPFWRYDISEKNYLFSSYHMSPENLLHYYNKLKVIQPKEIRGYPSSLNTLAQFITNNNLGGIKPKAVFTTAETLLEPVRSVIETAFQCKVVDTYGCTEMAFYITQCDRGTYHSHPEFGIVEVLDKNGDSIWGEPGELVATGFINYAMPLIRYKIGDSIVMKKESCSCNRNIPVIEQIVGRTDDIIVTPEGRRIGRLDPIFKGGRGIKEAQIIQTKKDEIVMKVVKDDKYSSEDIKFLSEQLKNRVGESMRIQFDFVSEIPREKNGKFRSVVSHLN